MSAAYPVTNQLARDSQLSYPVAARLLEGQALERIDVATIEALCRDFDRQPWDQTVGAYADR